MSKIIKANNLVFIQKEIKLNEQDKNPVETDPGNLMETFYQEAKIMVEELIEEAKAKAERILQEAKNEAENILSITRQEAEEQKKQVYEEAFQSGKEDGLKEVQALKEQANALIEKAYEERNKILQKMENEIVNLSINIAEKILRQQIENSHNFAVPIAQDLLAHVQDATQVSLKVSTKDYDFLKEQIGVLQSCLNYGNISLDIDHSLNNGDCIVVSETGIVVAKIDEQLEKLKHILQEGTHSD